MPPQITSSDVAKSRKILLHHLSNRGMDTVNHARSDVEIAAMTKQVSASYSSNQGSERNSIIKMPSLLDIVVTRLDDGSHADSADQPTNSTTKITTTNRVYIKYFVFGSICKITTPLSGIVEHLYDSQPSDVAQNETNSSSNSRKQNAFEHAASYANVKLLPIVDELIIVLPPLSPDVISKVQRFCTLEWVNHGRHITPYCLHELQYDVMAHVQVPPHRHITSHEQLAIIQKRYNVTDDTCPKICKYDPCARALGLKPGDWCEIRRTSARAVLSNYYRICSIVI